MGQGQATKAGTGQQGNSGETSPEGKVSPSTVPKLNLASTAMVGKSTSRAGSSAPSTSTTARTAASRQDSLSSCAGVFEGSSPLTSPSNPDSKDPVVGASAWSRRRSRSPTQESQLGAALGSSSRRSSSRKSSTDTASSVPSRARSEPALLFPRGSSAVPRGQDQPQEAPVCKVAVPTRDRRLEGQQRAEQQASLTRRWSQEVLSEAAPRERSRCATISSPTSSSRRSSAHKEAAHSQKLVDQCSSSWRRSIPFGAPVRLHVYNASWMATAALPIVHLGVEVYGCEFSFGDAGVRSFKPGSYDPSRHREVLELGHTALRRQEVYALLVTLRKEFTGDSYRLVGFNCQTFADTLCERLGFANCIPPAYVYFAKPFNVGWGIDLSDFLPTTLNSSSLNSVSGSDDAVDCISLTTPGRTEGVEPPEKYPPAPIDIPMDGKPIPA